MDAIGKAKAFIHEHLKDEYSLNTLAKSVGYSAFHLARTFKSAENVSIMEYVRNQRIIAASQELASGRNILDTAMDYCFETHAGFTKAFVSVFGCAPKDFQKHSKKTQTTERNIKIMKDSKIVIRHICKDDVQDLWENVYSAMTPKQINEEKVSPAFERYKAREGFELVAELDGKVVMALPLTKPTWLPLGFVWDNNFTAANDDEIKIMEALLNEIKKQAKELGVSALLSPQGKDRESSKVMQSLGFNKVIESGEWEYLMMSI